MTTYFNLKLMLISSMCAFASSAINETESGDTDLKTIYELLLNLTAKVDQLEAKLHSENKYDAGVCEPNPCLHGGRCEVISTGSDYRCTDCPYPTSGSHCEDFNCDDDRKCFHTNDTYYEIIETYSNWEQARKLCLSAGMSLVMLKDQNTNEFVANQTIAYSNNLWIGLKYNEADNQWRWVDGSPLGNYTVGRAEFKPDLDQKCRVINTYSVIVWETYSCSSSAYLLCEKRYSAR